MIGQAGSFKVHRPNENGVLSRSINAKRPRRNKGIQIKKSWFSLSERNLKDLQFVGRLQRSRRRCFASDAENVYKPCLFKGILEERFSEHVIGMSGDERKSVLKTADDPRMVKIPGGSAELYDIAYFQSLQPCFFGKRPDTLVLRKEVVKVFHARPGSRTILERSVKPPENGGKIHNTASCENTLGNKICTVAAQPVKIVKGGISSVGPFARIQHGFDAVVFDFIHAFIVC